MTKDTVLGAIAILLWSTTIAFSRSLTEQLGAFSAAAAIYTLAGVLACLYVSTIPAGFQKIAALPKPYLFGCGALFVAYMTCLYLAVGLAADRAQVLVVGLINYLWPALSLLFALAVLRKRFRSFLPAGILLALAGIWLAADGWRGIAGSNFTPGALLPYVLALVGAVSWALYTALSRRFAQHADLGAVPLFLLASGVCLGALRFFFPEAAAWRWGAALPLVYMAIFPGLLAYIFWDIAVRKGEIIFLTILSFFTPLLSTLASALLLGVKTSASLWLGALMVTGGAWICRMAVNME